MSSAHLKRQKIKKSIFSIWWIL